jgi:heme-degrading monooxygenase HmoA
MRKEPLMVARIAMYNYSGDGQELAARAEEGILPILKAQPGFRSYAVAISEDKVFSSSAWDSRAEAESGSAAIAGWVAENMTEISLIGDVEYAEVAFSTALGVSTA